MKNYITIYRVRRNHSNRTKFFRVDVPEVEQRGFGFQLNIRGVVYGISVHTKAKGNKIGKYESE